MSMIRRMNPVTRFNNNVLALLSAVLVATACGSAARQEDGAQSLAAGQGSFLFTGSPGARERPIRVWYHFPENLRRDAPVLFAMHGSGGTSRGGRAMRDVWVTIADRHGLVVIAPEFPWSYYPDHYNTGDMHASNGELKDKSLWAFTTVAALFDDVRRRFGIVSPSYTIYGHSAGGQFVHRMMIFGPDARVEAYVAANAGGYTMPTFDWQYPNGLDMGSTELNQRSDTLFQAALQRPLLLLIGSADTLSRFAGFVEADAQGFPLSWGWERAALPSEVMASGAHRMERAEAFFSKARAEAERRGVPFPWQFRVVRGVGHDNAGMAEGAARALGWSCVLGCTRP